MTKAEREGKFQMVNTVKFEWAKENNLLYLFKDNSNNSNTFANVCYVSPTSSLILTAILQE